MLTRLSTILVSLACIAALSGCVPVVIGAGGVIAADTIAEDREGGDGLF